MPKGTFGRRSIDEYGRINFRGMTELNAKQHRASSKLVKRARSTNVLLPYSVRIRSLYRLFKFVRKGIGRGFVPFRSFRERRRGWARRKVQRIRRIERRKRLAHE